MDLLVNIDVDDPFGHGFCLLQFVGRGCDEIATAEQHHGV